MNKCFFVGRVITEPEYRQAGGVDVCDFKLSVRTRGKNDQGYPNSIVVKCTAWRKLAEMARNFGLYKGQTVGASGMLDLEVYTDKNNIPRTTIKLDVDDMDFIRTTDMPSKAETPSATNAPAQGDADDSAFIPAGAIAVNQEELPF